MSFVPRLREILTTVEPSIMMDNPVRLDRAFSELLMQARFTALIFALIAVIGVVLSAAGLYALMAFAVVAADERNRDSHRTRRGGRRESSAPLSGGRHFSFSPVSRSGPLLVR